MEIWIRSQDKLKLVKNPNLWINNEFVDEYVIDGLSNGRYLELATYKTKERALEVLDEIQKRLINIQIYMKDEEVLKNNNPFYPYMECVYEMPKE